MQHLCFATTLSSAEWASWVQVIGSILAMIAAWLMGNRQVKALDRSIILTRKLENEDRKKAIFAIAESADNLASQIEEVFKLGDRERILTKLYAVYDKSITSGVVSALSNAPVHEIGSGTGVLAFLLLRDQVKFMENAIETYLSGPPKPEGNEAINILVDLEEEQEFVVRKKVWNFCQAQNVQKHIGRIHMNLANMKNPIEV